MEYTGFGFGGFDADAVGTVERFEAGSEFVEAASAHVDVYKPHPQGHFTYTHEHEKDTRDHAVNGISSLVKKGGYLLVNEIEEVTESVAQHKYAQLANSSYNYFNSKGKVDSVHEGLSNPDYGYIEDLSGFRMDEELSTIDNVVLHNEITGETHISYRGTTDNLAATKNFLTDWKTNGQIAGGSTHTHRVQTADQQVNKVIGKYGKENLSVSGHSQGGHVSYEIAVKNDLKGYHFNPAINSTQVKNIGKYADNVATQEIFKTPLDFASPLGFHKGLGNINIVQNLENMDGIIETHSIDQFAPKPKSVAGETLSVTRRTMGGSVVKGAGAIAGAGLAVYNLAEDIKGDVNNDKSALEKSADVTLDTAKNAEEFAVDGEIIGTSLALAPETMGVSLVVGLGAVIVNDLVAEHITEYAKEEIPKVGETLKKTSKKVWNFLKSPF
jgi:hypothetical protein